jgi:hypothetical protein
MARSGHREARPLSPLLTDAVDKVGEAGLVFLAAARLR